LSPACLGHLQSLPVPAAEQGRRVAEAAASEYSFTNSMGFTNSSHIMKLPQARIASVRQWRLVSWFESWFVSCCLL
jgi:hypothetical protein